MGLADVGAALLAVFVHLNIIREVWGGLLMKDRYLVEGIIIG